MRFLYNVLMNETHRFLPISHAEMIERGWEQPDFIFVSGDAYVDHPSFGPAIITRTLESFGYRVVMLAQPDWHHDMPFMQFGRPRLAFLVSSGNIDSMVNHYYVSKRPRSSDLYSDNGEMGHRPDRATIVYSRIIKRLYPDVPVIIGGIEASLRRLSHYDYWQDAVRHSILVDSQADLLLYGMGETSVAETAEALNSGLDIRDVTYIRGSAYLTHDISSIADETIKLPSFETVCADKRAYASSFAIQHANSDPFIAKTLIEPDGDVFIVQNPPAYPLSTQQMDDTYALPYMRAAHPCYHDIPAFKEVRFSITANRGCFGSCSFCALTNHQGRIISHRSKQSIVAEAQLLKADPEFKGYINDIGGPTANFYQPSCHRQLEHGTCPDRRCLFPKPCPNLEVSHADYLDILRSVAALDGIKKVFIRSGIRYDYLMYDKDDSFFRQLVQHHISGQLKVAPEHICPEVLDLMGKPSRDVYLRFTSRFAQLNKEYGLEQFLVPYLISSHPGSTIESAVELACYLKSIHHIPEQVQDFYPTPSSASTCMYYTGLDPFTMKEVYVEKDPHRKKLQRALLQYGYPANRQLVIQALRMAHRQDLIGYGPQCLVRPAAGLETTRH